MMAASRFLGFLFLVCFGTAIAAERPPNVIFILADDLGWQDVGFNGSTYFETPHLDALAKESANLQSMSMYPTCSPSRAALLTGKQSFRTQCYAVPVLEAGNNKDSIFSRWTVESKHKFYSQPLNEAGYRLMHLGKWHVVGPQPERETVYPMKRKLGQLKNGSTDWIDAHKSKKLAPYYPRGRGFHENVGGTWWGDPARGHKKGYGHEGGGYLAPYKNPFVTEGPDGEWLTDRLTNDAMRFIKDNKEKPFFVNLQYYAPHRPSVARNPEWLAKYKNKAKDGNTGQSGSAKKEIAEYATMVQSLDENVGRLVTFLNDEGLRDNTVIVFTSDNGFNGLQSTTDQLRGAKGTIYEGGLRVPCLVNWPGKIAPKKISEPVIGMDFFPTFLDLAGIRDSYKETLDGRSLLPLLQGKKTKDRALFWHLASNSYGGKTKACSIIRRNNWKLIQQLKDGNLELYDLKNDLKESNNLAKTNPEKAAELVKELSNWRKTNKVPLPPSSILKF